jgi:hypothetical protein
MTRPMPIPIAPPTRQPSSQTSMLCAQPSACSSALARIGSHQVPSLPRQSPEAAKPTLPAPG